MKLLRSFTIALCLVPASLLISQDNPPLRYAFVNTDRVLDETGLRDEITKAYRTELSSSNALLQEKQEELNSKIRTYNAKVQDGTWDDTRQQEEKQIISTVQKEVETMRDVLDRQLQTNAKERDSNTMLGLIALINNVASTEGYDWVFQVTNTLTPGVLVAPAQDDLTERVILYVKDYIATQKANSTDE